MVTNHINNYLHQADSLRFKLLAITGKNPRKRDQIVSYLKDQGWVLVDVEAELIELKQQLDSQEDVSEHAIGMHIKDWFHAKPNNLILTRASILYHEMFTKISPVGAFKYNSRNKNCVIFLEDEKQLGSRIYYGEAGRADYYDQEINDILVVKIEDIADDFSQPAEERKRITDLSELQDEAIGHLFQFQEIKDVIDIDADLREKESQAEIVRSYIISESLQNQIVDFFLNLQKPNHKAIKVIGNYGSGKSHLIAFLLSLVANPEAADWLENPAIRDAVKRLDRKFLTVQFELMPGSVELQTWFFGEIAKQLKYKYGIEIPTFDLSQDYNHKDNIRAILEIIKKTDPATGLMVVIDEISDFLTQKQPDLMNRDIQFLRVIGQVCQSEDLMFIGSMQEDVFTSPKFKNIAAGLARVEERFQNIIIHKEDIKKVIASRIVPKTSQQRHLLEGKLKGFAEHIEDVSIHIDDYIDIYPLTPFLLELFGDLPYFEKRGVIQFAMREIRYLLNESFPYFLTFDKIYDELESNPNRRNLEEIYQITRAVGVIQQKINLLDAKYHKDALRIIKALAVYSIWNKKEMGATAEELVKNLLIIPAGGILSAKDHLSLIIKKIREVTEGDYIKHVQDAQSGNDYFKFDIHVGVDPEEKINQRKASVGDAEVEFELFNQISQLLELENYQGTPDVYEDECEWKSVKSFRKGYLVFAKKEASFGNIPPRDYAIILVSPFGKAPATSFSSNQLVIELSLPQPEHVEQIKDVVAIKDLINNNVLKTKMTKKLDERLNGYQQGNTPVTGLKYRLAKLFMFSTVCQLNGQKVAVTASVHKETNNLPEIMENFKTALFDPCFNQAYPGHPNYPVNVSSKTIGDTLSRAAQDLTRGDYTALSNATRNILNALNLLDSDHYPTASNSKLCERIIQILHRNQNKVTDIEKELIGEFKDTPYGLEPELVQFHLVLLTQLGKVVLKARGGKQLDIDNLKEEFRNLAIFETIAYAQLQKDYSYEFAERLMNTLGINGAKIRTEKERLTAFREYKARVQQVLEKIETTRQFIDAVKERSKTYLDISQVAGLFQEVLDLDWQRLDIANHTQFANIEPSLNPQLPKLKVQLAQLGQINEALTEYQDEIHTAVEYMEAALKILEEHPQLVQDGPKYQLLQEYCQDVLNILGDFTRFADRAQRHPVAGKIQQFKRIYIYDFYVKAHEAEVGKKVDWPALEKAREHTLYQKISLLSQVTCISAGQFLQKVSEWDALKQHRCLQLDTNSLEHFFTCNHCQYPKPNGAYHQIKQQIGQLEESLAELFQQYEKTVIHNIRQYRDNIEMLDLSEGEKQQINWILEAQKLPERLDRQLINTINQLFTEIDVVEISREELIGAFFSEGEMLTLEAFHKAYLNLEAKLKQNRKEPEIRIKLK